MPIHFTLRQLDAFRAVADTGSFTGAARLLHLTPSAMSQLIIELESMLGYKLFERSTRKVVLSTAGRAFIPSALAIQRQVWLARTVAADIRDQAAGVVRVAAPLVVASVLLPRLIAAYKKKRPKIIVRVIDSSVESLVEKVASREVDLAVGPDRPIGRDVLSVPLFGSPWVVWCTEAHPFARARRVSWASLHKHELITAGRDHEVHLAARMQDLPDSQRVTPVQIVDNISTALGLAAAGLCYTISPAYVEALALPLGLVKRQIEQPVVLREAALLHRTDGALSPAANGFASFIEAELAPKSAGV